MTFIDSPLSDNTVANAYHGVTGCLESGSRVQLKVGCRFISRMTEHDRLFIDGVPVLFACWRCQ